MRTLITLCLFVFSSILFAHPHHNEADAIAHHGVFHSLIENGLMFLSALAVVMLVFKLVKYFNAKQSGDKS